MATINDNILKKYKAKKKFTFSSSSLIKWIAFVIFIVYGVTLLFPFLWITFNSFRDKTEFLQNSVSFPKTIIFTNYTTNLLQYESSTGMNIFGMFGVSIVLTIAATVLNVFLSAVSAYIVAKYDFWGKKAIFAIAVFVMVVPIVGTLPAQIRMMQDFYIYDTVFGLLFLYSGAFGLNFILLHGYFQSLSWTYAEAAYIDGATDFGVLFKIMLPLSKGAIIAVAILHAIGIWNDYATPLLFLPSITTLSVGLDELQQAFMGKMDYPSMFASITIAVLPILILFIIFQKTIIENTVAGGLKG